MMTVCPRCCRQRASAVNGFRCPVPGKQNAPSLAMHHHANRIEGRELPGPVSTVVRDRSISGLVVLALPLLVGPLEVFDAAVVEDPQPRCHFVDQVVIVRDQQHRALVALQRDVERVDGFEVEVVGRLVEDENVGLGEDEFAEGEPRLLAARERLRRLGAFFAARRASGRECRECLRRARRDSTGAANRPRSGRARWSRRRPAESSRPAPRGPRRPSRNRA